MSVHEHRHTRAIDYQGTKPWLVSLIDSKSSQVISFCDGFPRDYNDDAVLKLAKLIKAWFLGTPTSNLWLWHVPRTTHVATVKVEIKRMKYVLMFDRLFRIFQNWGITCPPPLKGWIRFSYNVLVRRKKPKSLSPDTSRFTSSNFTFIFFHSF